MSRNSFTWAQIREHYLNACGQTSDAGVEFFDHATAAYIELAAKVEIAELEESGIRLEVKEGDDRIATPEEVFAIHHIFNQTTGERVEMEESGFRGRSRYLEEDTGKPPEGTVHRYVRSGPWIYLRDTADEATTLLCAWKLSPPDVTKGVLQERPLTPRHLDWPIIRLAASSYYSTHPSQEGATEKAQQLYQEAFGRDSQAKQPKAYENRNKRTRIHQWGYHMGVDC